MTPASLLLGLSRKPLSPALAARAARLTSGRDAPARQALALLSEASLHHRTPPATPTAGTALPAPPPHPDYGAAAGAIRTLFEGLRAHAPQRGRAFLRHRGLLLPAAALVPELAHLRARRKLTPDDFCVLGRRGAYLFGLVERSPYGEGSLFAPAGWDQAFAKTAPQPAVRTRPALVGYALGIAGAQHLPDETRAPYREGLTALVTAAAWPDLIAAAAKSLIEHGLLGAVVAPRVLVRALPTDTPITPLPHREQATLLRAAAQVDPRFAQRPAFAKTRRDAVERLSHDAAAQTAPPGVGELGALASACVVASASHSAAKLFAACARSDNQLLRQSDHLATLLAAMDAGDYARSISLYAETDTRGWDAPSIESWLRDARHVLGPEDSERLVADATRHRGFGSASLAERFPLALHPSVVDVLHRLTERGEGGATAVKLTSVLAAAARVTAVYPRLDHAG